MKKIALFLLIFFLFIPSVHAIETPVIEGETLFNDTVAKTAEGKLSLNPTEILNMIGNGLAGEIRELSGVIFILIVIAALSGITGTLSGSFGNKSSAEAAFFACFTLMSAAAVRCFTISLEYGTDVINAMTDFITKLTPMLMIMLSTGGNVASAGVFSPVLSAAVYIISIIVQKALIPLICFGTVLSVAGNVSDKVQLSGFCRLVKSVSKWLMAAVITVFTGISAIYGFSAPALDAVSAKAVKFAVGSLVPVVGGFLSDTLETVISGTKLLKNAVGVSGIVVIISMCLTPIIKIGIMQLLLKLSAAVMEPITDERISRMIWDISESVASVFGMVIMTAVLFMINISIILLATGYGS